MQYVDFFRKACGKEDDPAFRAFDYQRQLAEDGVFRNRLIRIPTGFGKTAGAAGAWLWNRVQRDDDMWPRRLVWCLPMRVLVEQTEIEVRSALARLGLLWNGRSSHDGKVGVHLLMGGVDGGEWHLYPEHFAVLIGTQDMLLSRAMNRGYACPRARWPMEFGLLNQDSLWVMDEVQLMDVGLATCTQLQAFRADDDARRKSPRPCRTWWMSATLQADWLKKSPDTTHLVADLPELRISPEARRGHLWQDVSKPCVLEPARDAKNLAKRVAELHLEMGCGKQGPTLLVVNRVDTAVSVAEALRNDKQISSTNVRLVHSRFRQVERNKWKDEFLSKAACERGIDRIIVATQVIEAGVDISAALLITELAPWASLVQRFGRCARWGGEARVIVADLAPKDDKAAAPYAKADLDAAREALSQLENVAPLHLEAFEDSHQELLSQLYRFEPAHLLLRHELDELFDTTSDLSGGDIDISRFIRSGEERDVHVFWANISSADIPASDIRPVREALCAVPFLKARDWLCGKETTNNKAPYLKKDMHAWIWEWQNGAWRIAERRDLYPGQTVLVACRCGGYDPANGWDPGHHGDVDEVLTATQAKKKKQCWRLDVDGNAIVAEKEVRSYPADELADAGQDSEELSVTERWKTIATHGKEAGILAGELARVLVPDKAGLFDLAGRWHDAGKAHPAFQASIRHEAEHPARHDIAKAPDAAWPCSTKCLYGISSSDRRPGFRHELASVLALFGVLQRHAPNHPALLGPWRELLGEIGLPSSIEPDAGDPGPLEQEILALDADRFNLLAYLVCAHHGKLRLAWHAGKGDQGVNDGVLRIRGVREGDILPPVMLTAADGEPYELPASRLDLAPATAGLSPHTGASWTERVLSLVDTFGPFTLAWLEAILRAADQRASRNRLADPLLEEHNDAHELATSDTELARAASGGAQTAPSAGDTSPRGPLYGDGRRAGGRGIHPGTTRPPHSATRYVETQLGILSYQQLAPHLAERVGLVEAAIAEREFATHSLDEDLILEMHRRICGDLVPAIAGRWRTRDVQVGNHRAPSAWRVPMLMHDYAADLTTRVAHAPEGSDERLIETLTFAEGQLLHVHPFEDFNGRVSRLFIIELLYRLDLPIIDPATDAGEQTKRYFAALGAYDHRDSHPLAAFWRDRFEKEAAA